MITLIIVDCQNDFISGSMSIEGAKTAVNEIKNYINKYRKDIEKIIFTVDWHPYNHMSFKKHGGDKQNHCIQFTPGACIESKLLKLVQSFNINYEVSKKGEIEEVEELGAFNDIEFVTDELGQYYYFDSLVTANANTDFVICGINQNSCIQTTIQNLVNNNICPKIFKKGIANYNFNNCYKLTEI